MRHLRRAAGALVTIGTVGAVIAANPAGAVFGDAPDHTQLQVVKTATQVTGSSTPEDISSAGLNGWVEEAYDCNDNSENAPYLTPDQDFESGPGDPVLGAGSHVMRTSQFSGDTQLFRTGQFDGTYLSDIQHLSYSTFEQSTLDNPTPSDLRQPAYLRLSVDNDGDGTTDDTLIYSPKDNGNTGDADINNTDWQSWTPYDPNLGHDEFWQDVGNETTTTLSAYATAHPDSRIENTSNGGGVSFVAGCAGQNQTNGMYAVDSFGIETTDNATGTSEVTPPARQLLFDFDPFGYDSDSAQTITVTPNNLHNWNATASDASEENDAPVQQDMVTGPGTPPLGVGSHSFRQDANGDIQRWRNPVLDGIHLGDIRQLDYSTYIKPDADNENPQQPPYMRLVVHFPNGVNYRGEELCDGSCDVPLIYAPSNTEGNDIQSGTWQNWHTADSDQLWSFGGGSTPDVLGSLAAWASAFPDAYVTTPEGSIGNGGLGILTGCGDCTSQQNSTFYTDAVHVAYFHGAGQPETDLTYDFEPAANNGGGGGNPCDNAAQTPAPSINAPAKVVGTQTVNVTGHAVPGDIVNLLQKNFGESGFSKVASTTADSNGAYAFQRDVSKETSFEAEDVGSCNSATSQPATTKVAIAVTLNLSSGHKGRLHMHVSTDPEAANQTVTFWVRHKHKAPTVLATATTTAHGRAKVTIDAKSGHRYAVFATVTAPPGNEPGRSHLVAITVK